MSRQFDPKKILWTLPFIVAPPLLWEIGITIQNSVPQSDTTTSTPQSVATPKAARTPDRVFSPDNKAFELKVRHFNTGIATDQSDWGDKSYEYSTRSHNTEDTAIVIVSAFGSHPNEGYLKRVLLHQQRKLVPLLALARNNGMHIIHCTNGHALSPICEPDANTALEYVIDHSEPNGIDQLIAYFEANGIANALYAGYESNGDFLYSPTGFNRARYLQARGDIDVAAVMIRDCTLALENSESYKGKWFNKMAIYDCDAHGYTTTLNEIRKGLRE